MRFPYRTGFPLFESRAVSIPIGIKVSVFPGVGRVVCHPERVSRLQDPRDPFRVTDQPLGFPEILSSMRMGFHTARAFLFSRAVRYGNRTYEWIPFFAQIVGKGKPHEGGLRLMTRLD